MLVHKEYLLMIPVDSTTDFIGHQEIYVYTPIHSMLEASQTLDNLNLLNRQQNANDVDNAQLEHLYKKRMLFGTINSTTVTSQIGSTAHLPCIIHNVGDGVVS